MKRFISLFVLVVLTIAAFAFAADPAAVAVVAPVVPVPSFLAWIMANTTAVFGVALAVSEFMALIPGFQGNGILDSIVKALTVLSKKPDVQ